MSHGWLNGGGIFKYSLSDGKNFSSFYILFNISVTIAVDKWYEKMIIYHLKSIEIFTMNTFIDLKVLSKNQLICTLYDCKVSLITILGTNSKQERLINPSQSPRAGVVKQNELITNLKTRNSAFSIDFNWSRSVSLA